MGSIISYSHKPVKKKQTLRAYRSEKKENKSNIQQAGALKECRLPMLGPMMAV